MFGLTPFRGRRQVAEERGIWHPWQEMNRAFDQFFDQAWPASVFGQDGGMRVDIKETDKQIILEAEIPGVDKKDIRLELHDGVLTIAVDRDEQVVEEKAAYIRKERRATRLARSFHVDNVKEEDVKASYKNGILTVTLPKRKDGRKARSIEIQ